MLNPRRYGGDLRCAWGLLIILIVYGVQLLFEGIRQIGDTQHACGAEVFLYLGLLSNVQLMQGEGAYQLIVGRIKGV